MPRPPQPELALRIIVDDPVPGVAMRLQRGRDEFVEPTDATLSTVVFDLSVPVGVARPDGTPTFLGPFTQGPPAARFVYVNSGRQAGQSGTCWDRRAKVPLFEITADDVEAALRVERGCLEVRIGGRARDGGPVCGSVRLPPGGWRVAKGKFEDIAGKATKP
jgi:hypothetical protein